MNVNYCPICGQRYSEIDKNPFGYSYCPDGHMWQLMFKPVRYRLLHSTDIRVHFQAIAVLTVKDSVQAVKQVTVLDFGVQGENYVR